MRGPTAWKIFPTTFKTMKHNKCHVCLPPNRFLASFVDFEEDVFGTTYKMLFFE